MTLFTAKQLSRGDVEGLAMWELLAIAAGVLLAAYGLLCGAMRAKNRQTRQSGCGGPSSHAYGLRHGAGHALAPPRLARISSSAATGAPWRRIAQIVQRPLRHENRVPNAFLRECDDFFSEDFDGGVGSIRKPEGARAISNARPMTQLVSGSKLMSSKYR